MQTIVESWKKSLYYFFCKIRFISHVNYCWKLNKKVSIIFLKIKFTSYISYCSKLDQKSYLLFVSKIKVTSYGIIAENWIKKNIYYILQNWIHNFGKLLLKFE